MKLAVLPLFRVRVLTTATLAAIVIEGETFMNHLSRATMAALGRCFLVLISVCMLESNLPAAMVYTGTVVTDVRVGRTLFPNASLKITFEGDPNNILSVPVASTECGGFGWFLYLTTGVARMEIESQGRTGCVQAPPRAACIQARVIYSCKIK